MSQWRTYIGASGIIIWASAILAAVGEAGLNNQPVELLWFGYAVATTVRLQLSPLRSFLMQYRTSMTPNKDS